MMVSIALPDYRIGTYDSQATQPYFKGVQDLIVTVRVRSAEDMVEEVWHTWTGLVPSLMSAKLIEQIMAESPELPAKEDPSTNEFLSPE